MQYLCNSELNHMTSMPSTSYIGVRSFFFWRCKLVAEEQRYRLDTLPHGRQLLPEKRKRLRLIVG
jgi:hypothetical protein